MYLQPASSTIAHFLGVSNVHPVTIDPSGYTLSGSELTISPAIDAEPEIVEPQACFRSEDLVLSRTGSAGANSWKGTVKVASFQGSSIRYAVSIHPQLPELDVVSPLASTERFEPGSEVWASIDASAVQVLPQDAVRPETAMAVGV